MIHHGAARAATAAALSGADLTVTTYGTLLRDVEMFRALELDDAILDEAQATKNARSQSAKACHLLRAAIAWCSPASRSRTGWPDLGSIVES